jgi:hypothetical protein
VFYFPGTEKVDNDFLGSAEYQPEEVRFILDLNSSEEYKSDLTPEDGSVIFPFWKGDGYPPLLKPLYRIKVPLFPDLPSWLTPYVNIAQVIPHGSLIFRSVSKICSDLGCWIDWRQLRANKGDDSPIRSALGLPKNQASCSTPRVARGCVVRRFDAGLLCHHATIQASS